jgi:Arc/MetJ-type ribon-helix-helix transcriptional regulator
MTIHLTPEQEQRLQVVMQRGGYESVNDVVEAALVAVEHRSVAGFDGTAEEIETLLLEGLASGELTEGEFWESVNGRTDAMLAEHQSIPRS